METGQSITFKVKTGWAPSITMVNSDIAIELPKGASNKVIETGRSYVNLFGKDALKKVAKLHFKTTTEIIQE